MVVKFFTRSGCDLCDEARPLVEWVASRAGLAVEVVDIEIDDRLVRDYGLRIPVVVAPDGSVVAEGRIDDRRSLDRALRKTFPMSRRWPRRRHLPR